MGNCGVLFVKEILGEFKISEEALQSSIQVAELKWVFKANWKNILLVPKF